jgi:hypothetical protein
VTISVETKEDELGDGGGTALCGRPSNSPPPRIARCAAPSAASR